MAMIRPQWTKNVSVMVSKNTNVSSVVFTLIILCTQTCPLCMKEISNVDGAGQDVPSEGPANRERVVSECVPMEED